jgi:ACS family tartrate transporter-like MFS transporter
VAAQPLANALGAPLSGLILNFEGTWGLHGWQWMFILEGIPAIVFGLLAPLLLTDRPSQATWLSRDERAWLISTLDAETTVKESPERHPFLAGLKDRRALIYGLLNFGMVCGIYGLGLWLPTIVSALGHFGNTQLGLIVMIPYAASVPCVCYWSRRAARTGRWAWHASVSMGTAAVGLVAAGFLLTVSPVLALLLLTVAPIGIYSAIAPFLAMPTAVFAGATAAAGLGLVNSLGNIGGFVSPYLVGLIKSATGNTQIALVFLAGCLAVTGLIVYRYSGTRPEGNADVSAPGTLSPTNAH